MRQPTPNMTNFACKIATRHQIPVPVEAMYDFEVCRKFIDQWGSKPTIKQQALVKALASKQNRAIPDNVLADTKALLPFLASLQGVRVPLEAKKVVEVGKVIAKTYLDPRVFKHGVRNQIIPDKLNLAQVAPRVETFYQLAEAHYGKLFERPTIDFNLLGTAAGYAHTQANRLQFNPILLTENWEHFWKDTIPHEVAHLVCSRVHGLRAKAHGKEWQSVMRAFGVAPERCHTLDVGRAQVRRKMA